MSVPSPGRAYVGIGPPNNLIVGIDDTTGLIDLTTVIGVNLLVVRPDGTATWSTTITSQTRDPDGSTHILASHAYATNDCTVTGPYKITPQLVFSGGPTNCFTRILRVDPNNNIT